MPVVSLPPVLREFAYPSSYNWTCSGLYHELKADPSGSCLAKLPPFFLAISFDSAVLRPDDLEPRESSIHNGIPLMWPLGNTTLLKGGHARVFLMFTPFFNHASNPDVIRREMCRGFVPDSEIQRLWDMGCLPHTAPMWAHDVLRHSDLCKRLPGGLQRLLRLLTPA